jgi:hypothetical protein
MKITNPQILNDGFTPIVKCNVEFNLSTIIMAHEKIIDEYYKTIGKGIIEALTAHFNMEQPDRWQWVNEQNKKIKESK